MSAKFITGVITAAALIAALSAAPAQARDNDALKKFVIGAGSIFLLNEFMKEIDRNGRNKAVAGHSGGGSKGYGGYTRGKAPLPRACIRKVGGKKHKQRVATRNCLKQSYRGFKRLPKACKTTFWQRGNKRNAFGMRCLQNHGYSVAGRR